LDPVHWMRPGTLQLSQLPPLSVYVHLPWCLKKCPYCDFNSHEWRGDDLAGAETRYIDALMADLDASLPLIWGRSVQTVFIGGGKAASCKVPGRIQCAKSKFNSAIVLGSIAPSGLRPGPGGCGRFSARWAFLQR